MRKVVCSVTTFVMLAVLIPSGFGQRPAGPVTGSGQPGQIPLFVGSNTLGNSSFHQNPDGSVTASLNSKFGFILSTDNSSIGSSALFVHHLATSGQTFGVWGDTYSPSGVGVQGVSQQGGTGMHAVALNGGTALVASAGVNNTSGQSTALLAINTNSVDGEGAVIANFAGNNVIRAVGGTTEANATNVFTVDASGNVFIKGNLTKGSGSFMIDHPLDPSGKYLSHSFVESPDMLNLYNGICVLNTEGEANVKLPTYFQALNREFRYQLTAIGTPGPTLYIAEEISGNQFKIAGGKPGAKVSWQVTGIRNDAYANAHRIRVEEEKPLQEHGHYLHPELFGASEQQAIGRMQYPSLVPHMGEQ